MTYNIIVADDHKMFLEGLVSMLEQENDYHILFTAKNGANILKYLEINSAQGVDLIVTDISMPDVDGISLNKAIKKKYPTLKVLVVSMHQNITMINALVKSDVDGYVPKNSEKKELLLAMKTIISGEKYFSESIKKIYADSIFTKEKDALVSLTDREKEVLKLIALEHTTHEIAEILFLSKHTIESYRKNLISKLDVRNLAGLTKIAIKLGLVE